MPDVPLPALPVALLVALLVVGASFSAASAATATAPSSIATAPSSTATSPSSSSTSSGSSGTTTPSSPGASGGSVRGVTATTIRVAGLGDAARYGGADIGARARFQRANTSGGVHGRTFQYLGMRDDVGGATSERTAGAIVQNDRVLAVAPVVTPDLASAPDLVAAHVPYFGWALSSNFCGNDWGFSFTGCSVAPAGTTTSDVWGRLVAEQLGAGGAGSHVAIVTEHTDAGAYFVRTLAAGVKAAGLGVVSATNDLPVPAVADYDAIAHALLTSNDGHAPDAVFVMASLANVLQLQTALSGAGYAGVVTNTIEYEPDLVATSTGAYVVTPTAALETAPDNPAMAQLIADVRAVSPRTPIDQAVVAGYWSADLLVAAVERAGRNLTPESLARSANRGFTYRVTETVGPVTFPSAHDTPAPCASLVRSTGTGFVVAEPYQCGKVVPVGG
ncbi:MAG: ABC transporter substrate-binding protein [Acidimicrobiia bacterium]